MCTSLILRHLVAEFTVARVRDYFFKPLVWTEVSLEKKPGVKNNRASVDRPLVNWLVSSGFIDKYNWVSSA